MGTTTPRETVSARIDSRHADRLRRIAARQDTTVSRLVARILADLFDGRRENTTTDEPDR
jgi:hypothetical protein